MSNKWFMISTDLVSVSVKCVNWLQFLHVIPPLRTQQPKDVPLPSQNACHVTPVIPRFLGGLFDTSFKPSSWCSYYPQGSDSAMTMLSLLWLTKLIHNFLLISWIKLKRIHLPSGNSVLPSGNLFNFFKMHLEIVCDSISPCAHPTAASSWAESVWSSHWSDSPWWVSS